MKLDLKEVKGQRASISVLLCMQPTEQPVSLPPSLSPLNIKEANCVARGHSTSHHLASGAVQRRFQMEKQHFQIWGCWEILLDAYYRVFGSLSH